MRLAALVGTVVLVLVAVAPAATALVGQSFATCEQAAAAGFTDMARGGPGYSEALDADGDGIACDTTDATPPAAPATPGTDPGAEVLGATAEATPATDELAETGAPTWALLVVAGALLIAGRQLVRVADDHLGWVAGRQRSAVRYTVQPARRSAAHRRR